MQIDWTPLDFAERCNDKVKKEEVKPTLMGKYSLLVAAQVGTAEFVAKYIAQGADLAARDGCGRTALVVACEQGTSRLPRSSSRPRTPRAPLTSWAAMASRPCCGRRSADGTAWRRACASAAPRPRAGLALFRGEAGAVQVDLKERTVAFAGS